MSNKLLALAIAAGLSSQAVSFQSMAYTFNPSHDEAFVHDMAPYGLTLENWDLGGSAKLLMKNAWRMSPYYEVSNDPQHIQPLGTPRGFDLSSVKSRDIDGEYDALTIARDRLNQESMVITKNGQLIAEYYWNGMDKDATHMQMSVTKSFTAIVAGILAEEGLIDMKKPISWYLQQLKGTAGFGRATVEQVADMRSGIAIPNTKGAQGNEMMEQIQNWNGDNHYPQFQHVIDFAAKFDAEETQPGEKYHYLCINPEMLGLVIEKVTGKPLAQVIEERLWKRVGFEHHSKWMSSRKGELVASGGLNATTRDTNRMMMVLLNGGKNYRGEQVVPKAFIDRLLIGNDEVRNAWRKGEEHAMVPNGWYKDQIRVLNTGGHKFLAFVGVRGQVVIGEPSTGIVISMNGAQDEKKAPRTVMMTFNSLIPAMLTAIEKQYPES